MVKIFNFHAKDGMEKPISQMVVSFLVQDFSSVTIGFGLKHVSGNPKNPNDTKDGIVAKAQKLSPVVNNWEI